MNKIIIWWITWSSDHKGFFWTQYICSLNLINTSSVILIDLLNLSLTHALSLILLNHLPHSCSASCRNYRNVSTETNYDQLTYRPWRMQINSWRHLLESGCKLAEKKWRKVRYKIIQLYNGSSSTLLKANIQSNV